MIAVPERDHRGVLSENYIASHAKIKIESPKISFRENEEIPLEFIISNKGKEVLRLFPSGRSHETFQVAVKDETGDTILPVTYPSLDDPKWKRRNTILSLDGYESKEIVLHPHESYSRSIDINQFYRLTPGKKYYIHGYFYPNYLEEKDNFYKAEGVISFYLEEREKERLLPNRENIDLNATGLSPEEAIYLFLGSEKKKNWPHHFKWIDLSEYILSYDSFAYSFTQAEPRNRDLVLEDFKEYLKTSPSGKLAFYQVLSTEKLSDETVKVNVYVEREGRRKPQKFEYQYLLRREDNPYKGFWKIISIQAKVVKG